MSYETKKLKTKNKPKSRPPIKTTPIRSRDVNLIPDENYRKPSKDSLKVVKNFLTDEGEWVMPVDMAYDLSKGKHLPNKEKVLHLLESHDDITIDQAEAIIAFTDQIEAKLEPSEVVGMSEEDAERMMNAKGWVSPGEYFFFRSKNKLAQDFAEHIQL